MSSSIAAIVLTKNEGRHIVRCLESLRGICDDVVVVDSFSDDDTVELALKSGARVVQHAWKNYSTQFNFGVFECGISADWIWRIDADEYLEGGIGEAVKEVVATCGDDINGIYVRKRIDFMGCPLLHGGWYPSWHLKVFRRGHGDCENRWMDEHIRLFDGRAVTVKVGNQVDANLNDLSWWTDKHNGYATRELADMLMMEYGLDASAEEIVPKLFGSEAERKRWLKMKYVKSPLFVRPFINFAVRYIMKLGFLDGKEGFLWHILQGFWYRMLVDAKVFELKKRCGWDDKRIKAEIRERFLQKTDLGGSKSRAANNVALPLPAERRHHAA